ncbi:MAG: lamin tail domain-containing protein [bacterium]|nr:lamin tail domain-containing protein [bacterium]
MKQLAGFSLVLFLIPSLALALTTITGETLNGAAASATINLNDAESKVDINLTASEPVKWNTIAICLVSDTVCSRTTAVKYFTSTSAYANSVLKTWDGHKSDGEAVAVGDYKIKVTLKNESEEESMVELTDYLIKVVASGVVVNQTSASNDNQDNNGASGSGTVSAHLSSTPLSSDKQTAWQLDLGRERQVLVDQVVPFVAKDVAGAPADSNLSWSFGDGWSAAGRAVFHRYSRPGHYEVVVNGHANDRETVARTKITVLGAEFNLDWEGKGEAGAVVITNNQSYEVNLGGLKIIVNQLPKFTFPQDTILSAGQFLVLESALTKLTGQEQVLLVSPAGRVLATLSSQVAKTELLATVGELNQRLVEARNLLTVKMATSYQLVTTPIPENQVSVLTISTPTTTSLKLTAQAPEHWWQRWLKLIRVP